MLYSQKYTPPHCFFYNFASWVKSLSHGPVSTEWITKTMNGNSHPVWLTQPYKSYLNRLFITSGHDSRSTLKSDNGKSIGQLILLPWVSSKWNLQKQCTYNLTWDTNTYYSAEIGQQSTVSKHEHNTQILFWDFIPFENLKSKKEKSQK